MDNERDDQDLKTLYADLKRENTQSLPDFSQLIADAEQSASLTPARPTLRQRRIIASVLGISMVAFLMVAASFLQPSAEERTAAELREVNAACASIIEAMEALDDSNVAALESPVWESPTDTLLPDDSLLVLQFP